MIILNQKITLTTKHFKQFTSLDKDQFFILFDYCILIHVCYTKKELIAFLMKLRQGLSDDFIKSLINFLSRQSVSLFITKVRTNLMTRFENLGITSREVRDKERFVELYVPEVHNHLYNPNPIEHKLSISKLYIY